MNITSFAILSFLYKKDCSFFQIRQLLREELIESTTTEITQRLRRLEYLGYIRSQVESKNKVYSITQEGKNKWWENYDTYVSFAKYTK